MEIISQNAKVLYYLYHNKHKKKYTLAKLSETCLCNYFKTDNIIGILHEENFIKCIKRFDKNEYNYEIELTEKGKTIGKQLSKLIKINQKLSKSI